MEFQVLENATPDLSAVINKFFLQFVKKSFNHSYLSFNYVLNNKKFLLCNPHPNCQVLWRRKSHTFRNCSGYPLGIHLALSCLLFRFGRSNNYTAVLYETKKFP